MRYKAQSLKGKKFHHPQGYTRGDGFGIMEIESGRFVADENKFHPWDYPYKNTAESIANQFNQIGPTGTIYLISELEA